MTETANLPRESEDAHRAIAAKAASVLGAMIDGNGLTADQARLAKQNVTIHAIPGDITVRLVAETAQNQMQGRHEQGTLVASGAEAAAQIAGETAELLGDDDVQASIRTEISKAPGRGFGMQDAVLPGDIARRTFSVVAACLQCHGNAVTSCPSCHATGTEACQNCRGEGAMQCPTCFGVGMVQNAQGVRSSCGRCQQTGRLPCPTCQGQQTVACSRCQGQRQVSCEACRRTGYATTVYQVSYKAHCHFDIVWKDVDPAARHAAEALGLRHLAAGKHAEVMWLTPEVSGDSLRIPFTAFLPVADVEFSIVGKAHPATVAGLQGRITKMDPVLDAAVKPGISALMKLSKGPLAVQALIDTACKYKLIRTVLSGLTRAPKKAVYQSLVREYPVVLSDKYARAAVMYAHSAMQSITSAPRTKGLAAGTALAAVIAALYGRTPLRIQVLGFLAQRGFGHHILLVDIIIWLLGWAAAVFVIKSMAAAAVQKMLPGSVQTGRRALPFAGPQGLVAALTTGLVFLLVMATMTPTPDWAAHLLSLLKITP